MKVVLEKSNNDRFFLNKLKKSLKVVLKRKNIIEFRRKKVLLEKMDLESAGTSNGISPRKKFKHNIEKDLSKRDLASLPKAVLQRIFYYLDVQSIQNCAILCSTFYNLSKDNSLYRTLVLNYNTDPQAIKYQISKVTQPHTLEIEYSSQLNKEEDTTWFDSCIIKVLRNCGDSIVTLKIENCRNEEVLMHIGECINVERLILYKCKSSFSSLLSLCTLTSIQFSSCHFPPKVVREVIKNNLDLKHLHLSNNINVNPNEICELMSRENVNMKEIYLSERKMLKTKSLRTLARLTNLRKLEMISGPGFECNPEDSLELLAAGCTYLEKLCIHNWKEINDTNFIPALRMFSQLKTLELRGTSITIKSCREAALSLPLLETLDVVKCQRIKKAQLILLRKDFEDIEIPLG
ncbi:uncharacterized protein LOC130449466 [Diorhabda sublineata]|uniref:uncharacterized protein LOC130449466 n=1 Tax=Diorhabda sublineata TaxID=1163346 RepID=UPI0024E182CB|nr:uncharacterized protein LOC130449466 [Diorhabda sublineata]